MFVSDLVFTLINCLTTMQCNNEEINTFCFPLNSVVKVHNINFILKTLLFQLHFHDSEALAAL